MSGKILHDFQWKRKKHKTEWHEPVVYEREREKWERNRRKMTKKWKWLNQRLTTDAKMICGYYKALKNKMMLITSSIFVPSDHELCQFPSLTKICFLLVKGWKIKAWTNRSPVPMLL